MNYHSSIINNTFKLKNNDIELSPIRIEGRINSMHYKKGWKRRFIVREIDGLIYVTLINSDHKFLTSLYISKIHTLIMISGSFNLHKKIIANAFKEEFGEAIKIIGE